MVICYKQFCLNLRSSLSLALKPKKKKKRLVKRILSRTQPWPLGQFHSCLCPRVLGQRTICQTTSHDRHNVQIRCRSYTQASTLYQSSRVFFRYINHAKTTTDSVHLQNLQKIRHEFLASFQELYRSSPIQLCTPILWKHSLREAICSKKGERGSKKQSIKRGLFIDRWTAIPLIKLKYNIRYY